MHPNIIIDQEFKALIPPLSPEERAQLEANLLADGCRDPLVVWVAREPDQERDIAAQYILVDGHNRHEICTKHDIGFDVVQMEFADREAAMDWIDANQLGRRNLHPNNFTLLLGRRYNRAKKAQGSNNQHVQAKSEKDQFEPFQNTAEKLAVEHGVSPATVKRAGQYSEALAGGVKELSAAVTSGAVSVAAAADVATLPKEEQSELVARGTKEILQAAKEIRAARTEERRNERLRKIVEISTGNAPVGTVAERYPVIYIDPPWRYEHAESESRAIENQYPTMSLDEIKAMDMSQVAFDDCVMFMWATSPKLAEAFEVLDAWGFSYRTCAVWDKQKIGMGYYFRQQHELLLVAVKGQPPTPAPSDRPSSVLSYPRGQHSSKPHEVYEVIEAMYPTLPKLEMFCRTPREGWGVWGNQSKAA